MRKALFRDGSLTYVVTYAPEWKINGLTRVEMSSIASDLLGDDVPDPFVYCGGEIVAATGAQLRRLLPEIRSVWQEMLARHARREPVFHEEGHALSFVYHRLGYPLGNGDPFIRRMFTDSIRAENNVSPHDHGLTRVARPAREAARHSPPVRERDRRDVRVLDASAGRRVAPVSRRDAGRPANARSRSASATSRAASRTTRRRR